MTSKRPFRISGIVIVVVAIAIAALVFPFLPGCTVPGPSPEQAERYRQEREMACIRDCAKEGLEARWSWDDTGVDIVCWCLPEAGL